MEYARIGSVIRKTRISRGITIETLASRVGISSKFLYEIEKGSKGFSTKILCGLARELNVSCDYLVGNIEIEQIDRYSKQQLLAVESVLQEIINNINK